MDEKGKTIGEITHIIINSLIFMIVKVCTGASCKGRFSPYIFKRLLAEKAKYDTTHKSTIEECGCQGSCKTGPVIVIDTVLFDRMDPIKASVLYLENLLKK
ncbi:MAG: (2Fe-2S) ferredoxin domain-containing protein [Candidatus Gracilibacteria bacterium]|nr:(2Fe-2S) ferredoxin domain-containing protein [Candidatus Gracilibacteria bacterium]